MEFRQCMVEHLVFSLEEIKKVLPGFHRIQLDRWADKGYITKIRRGYYAFAEHPIDERFLFYVSNKIYDPSYVSLERALKLYGIMPESKDEKEKAVTAVTILKTARFKTSFRDFAYRHVKASLFWGFHEHDFGDRKILLAEPEKALLDYLYLNPSLKTERDFTSVNLNKQAFREQINMTKLRRYLRAFKNMALGKRVSAMQKTMTS